MILPNIHILATRADVCRCHSDLNSSKASTTLYIKRTPLLLSATILILTLLATFALWKNAQIETTHDLQSEFDFQARQTTRRIEQRMATYEQVLRGTQAHLLGSVKVGYQDFSLYVESLRLNEKFRGIQGIAIAEIVPKPMLDQHIASIRREGLPNYSIKPPGNRDVYSSITHIEPYGGLNLRALGFDMLTEPMRRAAMESARDTGQATASGKVRLIQETAERPQAGIVMYLPVYKRDMPAATVDERRASIVGWVGAPFRMDDLMEGLNGERSNDITLNIYDGDTATEQARLYHSLSGQTNAVPALFNAERHIIIAGRPWTLGLRSSPNFEKRIDASKPRFIAIAGLATSVLLSLLVWALASGRGRALALAHNMTHQLRESEFRWKYALEGAGDGVWDWNNLTNEVQYSKRWKAMLGYSDEEIKNTMSEWERLIHPDDAPHVHEAVNAYFNGEQPTYSAQFRMRCKDGSWKWILARAMAVSRDDAGHPLRTIGTHTDITRAKQDEQALREANARLAAEQYRVRVILQNSHDAFIAVSTDGHITDWNAKAEKTLGWPAAEAIGKDLAALIIPPELRAAHKAGFRRFIDTGKSSIINSVVEVNALHRDGNLVPVELAIAGIQLDSGYAISAFVRDISERKQAQQMEAERTQALEEARTALQHAQKLEAVGKLTGGVAHDFNNVLQVIGGNIQLLLHQLAGDDHAEKRLGNMLAAVDKGAKLSAQLLAFARRQPLQPVVLNPLRIVQSMDDLLQRALGERVEIRTFADEDLWNTLADPGQLENVILNLALNARDAMPDGGTLTIELKNARLDQAYAQAQTELAAGDYILLAISDTGIGMTREVMEQAFEPFFTTKPTGEGTGLGLSMAYGFVKQSGGHIRIYSEAGIGTTIRIYLPRSQKNEAPVSAKPNERVVGGHETILVVEDDVAVQTAVVGMLKDLGYAVLKADNGDDALNIIKCGTKIDLLFTDVVMPGSVSSPQLARAARGILPDLTVLFTSGYTRNALISGGRIEEGVQLLSKPYRREQLAQKVRQVLSELPAAFHQA